MHWLQGHETEKIGFKTLEMLFCKLETVNSSIRSIQIIKDAPEGGEKIAKQWKNRTNKCEQNRVGGARSAPPPFY